MARDNKAIELFGKSTRLNFPDGVKPGQLTLVK